MKKIVKSGFRIALGVSVFLISINCFSQPQDRWNKKEVTRWYKSLEWLNGLQLKPSGSINQLEFARQYHGNKILWDKAFEFLKTTDLKKLSSGKYVIDEENVTAIVIDSPPVGKDQVKWESHRKFNDLQYIITGKAEMGIAPPSRAKVTEPYDSKTDVANYEAKGKYYIGEPGTFFIFTPKDVHRPGIKVAGYDVMKKIVIKVRAVDYD